MPPKKAAGRPKLYDTVEEARRADIEKRRQRRQRQQQLRGPTDFIPYEPLPPCDVPIATRPGIGLRISTDIRVPVEEGIQEGLVDETDTQQSPAWNAPRQTALTQTTNIPSEEEDVEIARQIKQIQQVEQENSAEQEEYEARVMAQMTAADYEAAEALEALQSASEERQRSVRVSSQHSGFDIQRFDDSDLSAQRNSSPALRTNNNLINIQRSSQPLTPRNKNSARAQPRSSGSKGKRSVSFPAQKNNLLG
jgi:hypothetical protein